MDKLVTIANFNEPIQAHIAKYRLKTEGIESFLTGENFVATYWLAAIADRGVKLKVKSSEAEKAVKILTSGKPVHPSGSERIDSQVPDITELSTPVCPRCDSQDTEYQRFSRSLFFLSILFFRFPLPWWTNRYKCNTCGCKWKAEKS